MKAKRTALLGMLACLIGAAASAQTAPNNQGDIGLFTMPTADSPQPGTFTFGAYGWMDRLVAGNLPSQSLDSRTRLLNHLAGEGSLGLGITRNWSIFVSAGAEKHQTRGGWRGGVVDGLPFANAFDVEEARKIRVGTKLTFASEADPSFRIGLWLAAHAPVSGATVRQDETGTVADKVNSRRADWEWGAVASEGIFTGMISYQLSGKHDLDLRPANQLRFGAGVDVPVGPLRVIGELDRTVFDGGDFPEDDYSMLTGGVRFFIGRTGVALSTAVNANLDMLLRHGFSPTPIGAIVGLTYSAWPPLPPPPVVVPPPAAPAPVVEEKPEPVPAPAPAAAPPPAPAPKKTTDEIYFDAGSARLTNIAKALLDGVALRMKNDLNSTASITGYSDNSGKEEANLAISAKRAEAAKEYLVTRHGIDPNRITTAAKGSQEPAYDNNTAEGRAKNRRAVIVVTLVSGS